MTNTSAADSSRTISIKKKETFKMSNRVKSNLIASSIGAVTLVGVWITSYLQQFPANQWMMPPCAITLCVGLVTTIILFVRANEV